MKAVSLLQSNSLSYEYDVKKHTLKPIPYVGVDNRKQQDPHNFSSYQDGPVQALFR